MKNQIRIYSYTVSMDGCKTISGEQQAVSASQAEQKAVEHFLLENKIVGSDESLKINLQFLGYQIK